MAAEIVAAEIAVDEAADEAADMSTVADEAVEIEVMQEEGILVVVVTAAGGEENLTEDGEAVGSVVVVVVEVPGAYTSKSSTIRLCPPSQPYHYSLVNAEPTIVAHEHLETD